MDIPKFEDRKLTCADCGGEFTFEVGEQFFFWSKKLAEPKRCKPCRVFRKRSIESIMKERYKEGYNANLQTCRS